MACTHDIQSTSHPNSSRRRSNGIQLRGGGHDTCVDLSSAVEDGVGHGDAIDSATDHALVCSDSTEHPGIEAITISTPNCNVVQGCTEQLECSFLRLWAVAPEKPLLEELRRDAPKGRHFEVKQRRSVLAAVADESGLRMPPSTKSVHDHARGWNEETPSARHPAASLPGCRVRARLARAVAGRQGPPARRVEMTVQRRSVLTSSSLASHM